MAFDLKKEGDVKEYIEKLGIEYRFGCYNEKRPDGKCGARFCAEIRENFVGVLCNT